MADGSTFTGLVADYFLVNQSHALYGISVPSSLLNQISVALMNQDYQDRLNSDGAALTYQEIETSHQLVFGQFGLGIDCWTAYEPVTLLGDSAWSLMLNSGLLGSAGVWGEMFGLATASLADLYSPRDQQAYGELQADQLAAIKWVGAVTLAAAQALTAEKTTGWQPGVPYGSPINYTEPAAPLGQMPVLDVSGTSVQFAANGTGQAGDILVTVGQSANASVSITDATLATMAVTSTVTLSGDSDQVFSFGTFDALTIQGDQNTIYAGSGLAVVDLVGNLNIVRGGQGTSFVQMDGAGAAANFVIGGIGTSIVDSTAPATIVIGGPGTLAYLQNAPSCTLIGGSGTVVAQMTSDGAVIVTGSGLSYVNLSANGGQVVTGSGSSFITYSGEGGMFFQGDPNGYASFNVSGQGVSVCGGNDVTASGNGVIVLPWGAQNPSDYVSLPIQGYMQDATLASAVSSSGAPVTLGGSIAPIGGSLPDTERVISLNGSYGTVVTGNQPTLVTVNGSYDNIQGGTGNDAVSIDSGTGNVILASGGDNSYTDAVGGSELVYTDAPGPASVNLATGTASNGFGGTDTLTGISWVDAGGGSTLVAGNSNARLEINGNGGTLYGGAGVDSLTGDGNGITFYAGTGTSNIVATGTNDAFVFASSPSGSDIATIDQSYLGTTGTLEFVSGLAPDQLWFSQDNSGDLVATALGTDHSVIIDSWFAGSGTGHQLSQIQTSAAWLGNSQVNELETVMASYQASNPTFNPATAIAMPSDPTLQAALRTLWQT